MNKTTLHLVLLATTSVATLSSIASAQEVARVLSSTPVTQQVGVPRQACATTTAGTQQCSTQTIYESRTVGYKVVYEYAGRQYTTELPQDPGPTLQLRISVAPGPNAVTGAQPMQSQPAPGVATSASDPALYADPNAVMMAPGATVVPAVAPAYVYYDGYPGYVGYYNAPYRVWGPSIALGIYGGYGGWYGRGGGHHGRR